MPTPRETASLAGFQAAFAARLRAPDRSPLPRGVAPSRMAVYEELVFNGFRGFLDRAFPVTRKILGEAAWSRLARRFIAEYRCRSPLFRDIPREFLDWFTPLAGEDFPNRPWLPALMHYEWLELAAEIAPDAPDRAAVDPRGDLVTGRPALHPSVQIGHYRLPVHSVSPERHPRDGERGDYWYLVLRGPEDRVGFNLLSSAGGRLLEVLRERGCTGGEAILTLAGESGWPDPASLLEPGRRMLCDLRLKGAVMGTWRESP